MSTVQAPEKKKRSRKTPELSLLPSELTPVSWSFWQGERLTWSVDAPLAFDTETTLADLSREVPELVLASVSDGEHTYILYPYQIPGFLISWSGAHYVGHNMAFDFWVVDKYLEEACRTWAPETQQSKAVLARKWWWQTAQEGRLHDSMLLEMLIRLARGEGESAAEEGKFFRLSLDKLAAKWSPIKVSKGEQYRERYHELHGQSDWTQVDPGFFDYAARDALATWHSYRNLYRAAEVLQDSFRPGDQASRYAVYPDARERFGLLTEKVQVLGAIALAETTRHGIHFDIDRSRQLEAEYRKTACSFEKTLREEFPDLLKLDKKGQVILTKKGRVPSLNKKLFQEQLQTIAQIQGRSCPLSKGKKRQVSTAVGDWLPFQGTHPLIDSWLAAASSKKMLEFFDIFESAHGKGLDRVHASYDVLKRTGRVSAYDPNLQQTPRRGPFRSIYRAPPGRKLMAIDYSAIELRTLATVCYCQFGYSKLRDVLCQKIDPHAYTAAMFRGLSYEDFLKLKDTNKDQFKTDRQAAKACNFGIPGGLGAKKLSDYARTQYGATLSIEDAEKFRIRLTRDIYPELGEYLASPSIPSLSRNLGLPEPQVKEMLQRLGNPDMVTICLERVLQGKPVKADGQQYSRQWVLSLWQLVDALIAQARVALPQEVVEAVKNRQAHPSLRRRLLDASACTLTGRIRSGVRYTQAKNSPFQSLAADGAKLALWETLRQGYFLVGFIHDELLFELPADQAEQDARNIAQIVESCMSSVLNNLVPVETEYVIADSWSKG